MTGNIEKYKEFVKTLLFKNCLQQSRPISSIYQIYSLNKYTCNTFTPQDLKLSNIIIIIITYMADETP